jgi:hypothetical protein
MITWKLQPTHEKTVWFAFIDNKPVAKTSFFFAGQRWHTQVINMPLALSYNSLEEAKEAVENWFRQR